MANYFLHRRSFKGMGGKNLFQDHFAYRKLLVPNNKTKNGLSVL